MTNGSPAQPPGQGPYPQQGPYPGGGGQHVPHPGGGGQHVPHPGGGGQQTPYPGGGGQQGPPSFVGPPPPGAAGPPPESSKPKRKGAIAIVVAVVAIVGAAGLVAAIAAGVYFFNNAADDRPETTAMPDSEEMPFPDLEMLGYGDGADAMCAAIGEIMATRGYELAAAEETAAVSCTYRTPGMALLEDEAYNLQMSLSAFRGDGAGRAYDNTLEATTRTRDKFASDSQYTIGELYDLPVGDEGFFSFIGTDFDSDPNAFSNATVAFRSGDDTIVMNVSASVSWLDKNKPSEQVPEDITYGESIDVLKALNGDESAGEPLIAAPQLEEYPGLPDWNDPLLPDGAQGDQRCAPATSAAEQLGMDVEKTETTRNHTTDIVLCDYKAESEGEGSVSGSIHVRVREYGSDGLSPTYEFGEDVRSILATAEEEPNGFTESVLGPLYELPVGDGGYLIYTESVSVREEGRGSARLQAGWVVGDSYYSIDMQGARWEVLDGPLSDPVALSEEDMVDWLGQVLTAMDS